MICVSSVSQTARLTSLHGCPKNPLTWTDGKKYAVTSEKQAQLTSALAVQQVAESAGVERERDGSTGDECTVWRYALTCVRWHWRLQPMSSRVKHPAGGGSRSPQCCDGRGGLGVAWNYAKSVLEHLLFAVIGGVMYMLIEIIAHGDAHALVDGCTRRRMALWQLAC